MRSVRSGNYFSQSRLQEGQKLFGSTSCAFSNENYSLQLDSFAPMNKRTAENIKDSLFQFRHSYII